MMERFHAPLRDAGVTVDLLFAHAVVDDLGDADTCALKLHGYQVAAICRINSYKLRVQGHGDAEITIDGDRWYEWSEEQQAALIDHELEHLALKTDSKNRVIRDDLSRPKLLMRTHDHQFGWFNSVARRHGLNSFEMEQAKQFVEEVYDQLWLPFVTWMAIF